MTNNASKIDLVVDGTKFTSEGKEVQLLINGMPVYDNGVFNSLLKLNCDTKPDFEVVDVLSAMRILNAMFGNPERYRIVTSLKILPKSFTEVQKGLSFKPATLDFHMKKLLNELIVYKTKDKKYALTVIGEAFLNYFTGFLRKNNGEKA